MNFEILFFVFIVGVMIISQVFKHLARTSGEKGEKPVSGWRKALDNILEEIRREMEKGKQATPAPEGAPRSRETWWEDLMPEGEAPGREVREDPGEAADSEKAAAPAHTRDAWEKDAPDEGFSRPWGREARPESPVKQKPPAIAHEKRSPMSRRDLRNAVVWSEILGRPVALRDMDK